MHYPVVLAVLALVSVNLGGAEPPTLGGCRIWPDDNIWNTQIDRLPIDPKSSTYVSTIGEDKPLVPDFGAGTFGGGPIGIPFVTIPGDQPRVAVSFDYNDESDAGPYPIPPDPLIEGGPQSKGDRHVLLLDAEHCILYELFSAYPEPDGTWKAASGAIFDLRGNALRTAGWTSADAAGFAILPGLVRYDEVAAGEIRHAIRFTVPQTRREYVWPATHFASKLTGLQYPPMGQRFRLRADYDVSKFSPANQVILRALKTYGMLLADNGSSWFMSGAPDERWNNTELRELRRLRGLDFEAVDTSSLRVDSQSGQVRGVPSAIRNAASRMPSAIAPGEIVDIEQTGLSGRAAVVTFNDMPADSLEITQDRVRVTVPWAVAQWRQADVRIRADGTETYAVTAPVAGAAPGLFTADRSGSGAAAALNQDQQINSESEPAAIGSIVSIYANGAGATEPSLPIAARIAGLPAEIVDASRWPKKGAALLQVNVRIPAAAPSGRAALLLTIGGYVSQPEVFLFLR